MGVSPRSASKMIPGPRSGVRPSDKQAGVSPLRGSFPRSTAGSRPRLTPMSPFGLDLGATTRPARLSACPALLESHMFFLQFSPPLLPMQKAPRQVPEFSLPSRRSGRKGWSIHGPDRRARFSYDDLLGLFCCGSLRFAGRRPIGAARLVTRAANIDPVAQPSGTPEALSVT